MMAVKFVAEISSNHNSDLDRCRAFIRMAKDVGCDAVKFQLFKIEFLFAPEVLEKRADLRARKAWELPLEYLAPLAQYAHQLDLEFSCTPFYLEAVDQLEPYVDFYKVASYELLWHDLLRKCGGTGKPLVISTGMATLPEIDAAIRSIRGLETRSLTVLQCTSAYPTPVSEANLRAIDTMRAAFAEHMSWLDLSFGLSDHTVSPAVILKSVFRYDVSFIEFHFDLDGMGNEFDAGHCWLPEQIRPVIKIVREAETVDGEGTKEPTPSELSDRDWRADPSDGLRPLMQIRHDFNPGAQGGDKAVEVNRGG